MDQYSFILEFADGKTITSRKFPESNYRGFIRECERVYAQHKDKVVDIKICCHTEYGSTFVRSPEHGEIFGW